LEQELVEPRNAYLIYDEVVLKKDRFGKDLLHRRPTFASIPELLTTVDIGCPSAFFVRSRNFAFWWPYPTQPTNPPTQA
jgi:hypothetical protein